MIVVIGDLHGCIDPLRALINQMARELRRAKKIKFIFLGDYIDHGPSSKEVVDFLIDLPYDKVLLMGNHEDMLQMYMRGSGLMQEYGNIWCTQSNGGLNTVRSFHPDSPLPDLIAEDTTSDNASRTYIKNNGEFQLDEKYQRFFEGLVYLHEEKWVDPWGRECRYLFSHATPNPKIPLEEVFAATTHEEFHALEKKYDVPPQYSNIWFRRFLTERPNSCVLVHGHSPTHGVAMEYHDRFEENEEMIQKMKKGYPYMQVDNQGKPVQINLDTGAVYGKALSAMVLLDQPEEFEDPVLKWKYNAVFWWDLSRGYRQNQANELKLSSLGMKTLEHPFPESYMP